MGFIKQALLALLLCAMSAAHAASIGYTATSLGGTQWRYDYTVSNTTLAVPIEEFTVFFSVGRYAKLHSASTLPGWDLLLVQPDPAISASGYLDALALAAVSIPARRPRAFPSPSITWARAAPVPSRFPSAPPSPSSSSIRASRSQPPSPCPLPHGCCWQACWPLPAWAGAGWPPPRWPHCWRP